MTIPREIVDEVRARADIVQLVGAVVTLKRQGRSYVGLCPFHSDRKPSFSVVPDKGIYHCFPCGEGGDVFRFLMKTRGLSFVEAVKELAGPLGITVPERELTPDERRRQAIRNDLYGVAEEAARVFSEILLARPEGEPGRAYLATRGVTLETARTYRLGYAPPGWDLLSGHLARQRVPMELAVRAGLVKRRERGTGTYDVFRNRLIFPIHDDRGRPIAFGGRLLPGEDEGPKYLNSAESDIYDKSRTLYGLHFARTAIQRADRAVFVEGYFDAVSLWQAGFQEAVATCGTSLTPAHVETTRRLTRTAVALFDADEAGMRAAARSLGLFLEAGIEARRVDLGDAKDPDEFVQRHGATEFDARLKAAEPLVELLVRRTIEREGRSAEGRVRALHSLAPTLARLPDLLRAQMITRTAGQLGIREEQILVALDSGSREDARSAAPDAARAARWLPTRELTHLLWLATHYPTQVAPALTDADPDVVSDRRDVLAALARIVGGTPLPSVIDECSDPDVARTLRAVAARDGLYTEESAESAAREILSRLTLVRVEGEIANVRARIAACEAAGDKSSYGPLARQISSLYQQRERLRTHIARRPPMSANLTPRDPAR